MKRFFIAALAVVAGVCMLGLLFGRSTPPTTIEPLGAPPTSAPTRESVPTASPQPTVAPAPDAGDAQRYFSLVMGPTGDLGQALTNMGNLLQNPRIGNSDWTTDVAENLVAIRTAHTQLTQVTPPAAMRDIHANLIDATSDCNDATYHVATGIDTSNVAEMHTATDLLASCTRKITRTTKMLKDYSEAHN